MLKQVAIPLQPHFPRWRKAHGQTRWRISKHFSQHTGSQHSYTIIIDLHLFLNERYNHQQHTWTMLIQRDEKFMRFFNIFRLVLWFTIILSKFRCCRSYDICKVLGFKKVVRRVGSTLRTRLTNLKEVSLQLIRTCVTKIHSQLECFWVFVLHVAS